MTMRVLVCCRPGYGHLHPFVPLARAIAAAGHEVVFATGGVFREHVKTAGFGFAPSGPAMDDAQRETVERFPEAARVAKHQFYVRGLTMFASVIAPQVVADLTAEIDRNGADLLLFEVTEFGAPVVASARGIPAVLVSWGPARPPELVDYGAMRAADLWAAAGLPAPPDAGMRTTPFVDICPPSLQTPWIADHARTIPMRYVPYESPALVATSWAPRAGRRLVYITLGTVFSEPDVFRAAIAGAARCDADVVVTVGPTADPAALGEQPPNVHIERYIPQSELLPRVAALVSHGGSGALMGAASYGVPHVVLPQGADQFANADALEASGAGVALRDDATPDAVEAAVRAALDVDAMRVAAQRLAAENALRPHPAAVVPALEAYASDQSTRPRVR